MSDNGDLFRALYDDGRYHLAASKDVDGGFLGALLDNDTNVLSKQAVFIPVSKGEADELLDGSGFPTAAVVAAAAGVAIGVVATLVAVKNAPRIKSWWKTSVLPSVTSAGQKVTQPLRSKKDAGRHSSAVLSNDGPKDFSKAIDLALLDEQVIMSSEEAQKRLLSIYVAAAFIAEQMRALANADIRDKDRRALQGAMAKLTPSQMTDTVNRILTSNVSLLDDDTSREFLKIFGGGRRIDGVYEPLRNDRVRDALRLSDGDDDAAPARV